MSAQKTAIITGASGSIGTGLVQGLLDDSYNVVATSLNATQSAVGIAGYHPTCRIRSKINPLYRSMRSGFRFSGNGKIAASRAPRSRSISRAGSR
jgi:NAD(P)-dependent dehydrogenase (short-subunit alcohol dehydrogenase family)